MGLPGFAKGPDLYDIRITIDGLQINASQNLLTAALRWRDAAVQALAIPPIGGNNGKDLLLAPIVNQYALAH